MTEAHLSDQLLKAGPIDGRGARLPLVAIDDDDLLSGPPQRHGPLAQRILAGGALGMFQHLP